MKKHVLGFLVLACMYNADCPSNKVCVVDVSGHGFCQSNVPAQNSMDVMGECTFNTDCFPNEVCVKKDALSYGKCVKNY